MGTPYLGEIRMVGFNFAPPGWALCEGQLLPIDQNYALFQLIGTYYGGDGQTTFALPDLRGRVPMHQGNGHPLSEKGGVETVTLTTQQIPAHTHIPNASASPGTSVSPTASVWAASNLNQFAPGSSPVTPMNAGAVQAAGGSQPHDNVMPYLAVNFIIALAGDFPSQS